MLVIRLQRTGRKSHAMFRVIVQDSRRTPTSGKLVAFLGSYDPHTKNAILSKEKVIYYLEHGAQPSERVAKLLSKEGVKLPAWVRPVKEKSRVIRNPEKLRRNQSEDSKKPSQPEAAEQLEDIKESPPTEAETPNETIKTDKSAEVNVDPEQT